jgi:hypothetical protein
MARFTSITRHEAQRSRPPRPPTSSLALASARLREAMVSAMDGEATSTSSFCAGLLIDAFRAAMGSRLDRRGSDSRRVLRVRLRRQSQVGLQHPKALGELRLGILVGDCRRDDHLTTLLPVDRGGDAVTGSQLERIKYPQDLIDVATHRGRVR